MRLKTILSTLAVFFSIGNLIENTFFKNVYAKEPLVISAIPDQNPEKLNRLYSELAKVISEKLEVKVEYKPVINYQAAVSAFRTKNLDLVWFGGLTGVQARLQSPGAIVIAQRDIDRKFKSIFIANKNANLKKISTIKDLVILKGKRFTFGSESSTSGRLMPEYYLRKSNVNTTDFKGGRAGFSGSHDRTIALVESGSYEAGVLNHQVWNEYVKLNKNSNTPKVIFTTPHYADYHWLAQGDLDEKFGEGFTRRLKKTILDMNNRNPQEKKILSLFSANKFVNAHPRDYKKIEEVGRKLGKIR